MCPQEAVIPIPRGWKKGRSLYTVQCDFDDTITIGIVSQIVMEAFFPGRGWQQMEEEFTSGRISVEECNRQQLAQVQASQRVIQDFVARTVEVRPGFSQVVEYCRREGIRFSIVSSGLDLYIEPVLQKLGLEDLEVHSGQARFTPQGITIDYIAPWGDNLKEGFKLPWSRHLRNGGQPMVYIGDGMPDIPPALEADHVIARSELRDHLQSHGIPHLAFETFYDVQQHLQELGRLGS